MSKKILVAYFSCSGATAKVANDIAEVSGSDLYEIKPEIPYTNADLNWMDKQARSTIEMHNPSFRPAILGKIKNFDQYDAVFLGFPIWWYVAPTIINTFLESYDFADKTIVLFVTSGGSGFGQTVDKLKVSCSETTVIKEGKLLNSRVTKKDLTDWIKSLDL